MPTSSSITGSTTPTPAPAAGPISTPRAARRSLGLGVNAGHDLNLVNLAAFIAIGDIDEVSIGHALIADALELGLSESVRKYLDAIAAGLEATASAASPD